MLPSPPLNSEYLGSFLVFDLSVFPVLNIFDVRKWCVYDYVLMPSVAILWQVSIVLRGANDYMLDEMERSIHDSLSIVKRTLESNTVSRMLSCSGFLYSILVAEHCGCN